jgi:hypothetical protein
MAVKWEPDTRRQYDAARREHRTSENPRLAIAARCPRLVAHLICHSLGYATPQTAADILAAAHGREEHYCEWIDACYQRDPLPAVRHAIQGRHSHSGPMAEYGQALLLVVTWLVQGRQPDLASWF